MKRATQRSWWDSVKGSDFLVYFLSSCVGIALGTILFLAAMLIALAKEGSR